jgi:hypothetical protein
VSRWRQLVRRYSGRDPNPLCRAVDRAEARAMTSLLVLAVLSCIVLCVLAGQRAYSLGLAQQRAERGWRAVTATLEQSAAQSAVSSEWEVAWVPARWRLPDGQRGAGQVATELDAHAGQKLTIWASSTGQQTRPPMTFAGVCDQVIFTVLWVVMTSAIVTGIAAWIIRLLCDRCRMAGWQRAWDAIGPTWSTNP